MTSLNTDMCSCRKRWLRRYQKITSTPAKVHWSYCGRKSGEALALLRYILPKMWGSRRARVLTEFCRVLDGNIMKFTSLSLTFSSLSKSILNASVDPCWFYIDDLSISRLRSKWFSTEVRGQSWFPFGGILRIGHFFSLWWYESCPAVKGVQMAYNVDSTSG